LITLTREGVGDTGITYRLTTRFPEAKVPVRAFVEGSATYTLFGRFGPDDDWESLRTGETADGVYGIPYRPDLRLAITAGTGRVSVWVAES